MIETSVDAATAQAAWALGVSLAAAAISLAAAGFTGWEAITGHLTRVDSIRAKWVFGFDRTARGGGPQPGHWFLTNSGGSTATDVRLVVRRSPDAAARSNLPHELRYRAGRPIHPGERMRLHGTHIRLDPGNWWFTAEGEEGGTSLRQAGIDKQGLPVQADAFRATEQFALVMWKDEKGKRRKARIPLY